MARTIATNTTVDRAALIEFLRPRHQVILLTPRADGGWQGSPVTAGVDPQGRIVVATYPERAKSANVARHGKAAMVVLSQDFNGPWVQVEGDAELLTLPEALEPLVEYFRSIAGDHPDWEEYRAAMTTRGKAMIRITPTRWGPIATGGFPARLG